MLFGGYTSKIESSEGGAALNIKGAAVFGGVELVN